MTQKKKSVSKIRNSGKTHAHKIQAAVAMEQRAKEMGKTAQAGVYRSYINSMKKKTKKNEIDFKDKETFQKYNAKTQNATNYKSQHSWER
jgi:hypothetical protein